MENRSWFGFVVYLIIILMVLCFVFVGLVKSSEKYERQMERYYDNIENII